jgi:hypothetical protein
LPISDIYEVACDELAMLISFAASASAASVPEVRPDD